MDRNYLLNFLQCLICVALRKESVDRNHDDMLRYRDAEVALRKESVDRNVDASLLKASKTVALRKESVDRNWIPCGNAGIGSPVALRKESVDRNIRHPTPISMTLSRSPQGERG